MHPELEHMLDWFHVTLRITVLNQFAKELTHSDPEAGKEIEKYLESIKWYLWHGNAEKALDRLEECYLICDDENIRYKKSKKIC